ncbi:MAG TPA: hypothetical protein VKS01_01255 [Bryobacteraceae bacterium]|nr:hypothetical protein [Bryobacteraceae bacterium]
MSGPIIPTPLVHIRHPFSFFPPIRDIEHNEWIFRSATPDEIRVMNAKTQLELFVPRRFVGEVSLVGEPVMIVGLVKELEYREGAVYPHVRRVLEMPRAVNQSAALIAPFRSAEPHPPAEVVGIRVEASRRWRAGRLVFAIIAALLLACLALAILFRDATFRSRTVVPPSQPVIR